MTLERRKRRVAIVEEVNTSSSLGFDNKVVLNNQQKIADEFDEQCITYLHQSITRQPVSSGVRHYITDVTFTTKAILTQKFRQLQSVQTQRQSGFPQLDDYCSDELASIYRDDYVTQTDSLSPQSALTDDFSLSWDFNRIAEQSISAARRRQPNSNSSNINKPLSTSSSNSSVSIPDLELISGGMDGSVVNPEYFQSTASPSIMTLNDSPSAMRSNIHSKELITKLRGEIVFVLAALSEASLPSFPGIDSLSAASVLGFELRAVNTSSSSNSSVSSRSMHNNNGGGSESKLFFVIRFDMRETRRFPHDNDLLDTPTTEQSTQPRGGGRGAEEAKGLGRNSRSESALAALGTRRVRFAPEIIAATTADVDDSGSGVSRTSRSHSSSSLATMLLQDTNDCSLPVTRTTNSSSSSDNGNRPRKRLRDRAKELLRATNKALGQRAAARFALEKWRAFTAKRSLSALAGFHAALSLILEAADIEAPPFPDPFLFGAVEEAALNKLQAQQRQREIKKKNQMQQPNAFLRFFGVGVAVPSPSPSPVVNQALLTKANAGDEGVPIAIERPTSPPLSLPSFTRDGLQQSTDSSSSPQQSAKHDAASTGKEGEGGDGGCRQVCDLLQDYLRDVLALYEHVDEVLASTSSLSSTAQPLHASASSGVTSPVTVTEHPLPEMIPPPPPVGVMVGSGATTDNEIDSSDTDDENNTTKQQQQQHHQQLQQQPIAAVQAKEEEETSISKLRRAAHAMGLLLRELLTSSSDNGDPYAEIAASFALREIKPVSMKMQLQMATNLQNGRCSLPFWVHVLPARRGLPLRLLGADSADSLAAHLHARDENDLLKVQLGKCLGCGEPLTSSLFGLDKNFRMCSFFGGLFCRRWCHEGGSGEGSSSSKRVIPSRLLRQWDVKAVRVCKLAASFLDRIAELPLLRIREANALLVDGVPRLKQALIMQKGLRSLLPRALWADAEGCMDRLLQLLGPSRQHLALADGLFSLNDLLDVQNGQIKKVLSAVLSEFSQHQVCWVLSPSPSMSSLSPQVSSPRRGSRDEGEDVHNAA